MRMVSTLYTLQIVVVVSMVWRPSHAVIQLSCGSKINLNPSSTTTYRFGDYINPYQTGLSCDFDFSLLDTNEKILFQVFPQCTERADVLKINDGSDNKCCTGCEVPIAAPSNAFQVSITTDSTSGPEELGFVIRIATANCTTSSPSPIIVSVGSSPVIITSPGFPNRYPTFSDCRYTISPHDSSKGLSLTFDVISLDYYNGCYDKIQLGLYNTDPVDICTNYKMSLFLTNERYTSGGETHLNFTSDDRDEGYGFRVTIVQVDLGATQSPTTQSTTAVQTVETTSSETTTTSTAAAQSTETTAASTTAFQTTETTAASAHVGTTTETIVKSTPTSVPATVQSVSSTITASSAESTAVVSTAAPHTDPSTVCPNASYYGDNCSTSCHQNCLDGRCDVVDGTCLGCIQGYTGSTCETATTPNPCLEYRDARYLSDDCGNHSSTGYCAQSNSACLPSEDGLDWTCRCIHSHYNHNSSCVPVPSSLFEHKVMALGSLKSDRIVSLSQEDTNNSEHLFEFGDAVEDINSNSSNCVIRTFNSGFNCSLNSSGIIVGVNKVLDSALYHVIVHVTLQIGSENAEVEDTLSILFEVQATQQNHTILIAEGTLKDTLITTVDLKVNDTNPSLQGNAHFLSMDSNGLVKTNQTTLLDTDFVSQMFTAIVYDNIFLNIVVYKLSHQISINENTNGTVICKTDPMVNSALLQTKDFLLLLPDGSIVVKEPFDYEMIKEYTFDLFGQVDDKNFTIKIALNILDVNDNPPILGNNYIFIVTNSQLRALVGVVPATDPDTVGVLNYSITDEGGDSRFLIGSFGEVSMVNTRRGGNAIVTVTDGVFYVNASVTVNVVSAETNDTHETFVFDCNVSENSIKGTSFCNVSVKGYIKYAFDHQSDRTKFNLNSNTGDITTNAPLDREDIDHYDYSVTAIQSEHSCKFATIRVKISVLDENDETPMFDQPVYRGKIRENAKGTKVTLETPLKVTDRDLNSTFIFNISGTAFTISSTGEIFSSDETIDRETHSSYSLTVMVSDEKHETFSIVEISVEDMNDNPPMAPNRTFSVLENATEDTDIGQVIATDADIGINAQLIFTDASSGYFEVNITGFLKVNRLLDRETKDKDVFTVSVCDSGRDISLCIMPWITVNILDVNEAPSFKYNKEVPVYHIPENSNCSSISDLTEFFVDGDLGVNRELDFSVLSESDIFHIDSNGKLSCPGLDYDDSLNKVYALTIQATDRGDPPLFTNGTIIIVVEDVNDNAPIPSDDINFEIVFYSGGCKNCSKLVALITATDKDSGINGEIEFQESSGNASEFLKIDTSSGLIEASTIDMSLANGTYLYIVNITDKGTPSRGTTVTLTFNVAVLMNTQISRVFNKDKLIFNWTENDAFRSPFIDVKNFTKDAVMSIKTFVLPNYNLGDFYLNGSKQEFLYVNRTKHSTFFDRETQHQYRFIIQAKLPLYSMLAELTITIIDVNDNPPRFQSDIAQVALIKENATNGTSLNLTFDATDRDEGENAQIAYKISNDNCDNVFQLNNSDSGNIVLIGKLDYEDKEYCNLTLTVFNPNNETMQSSVDVHIEIVDVNDNSPLFDQSVYHVSINERVKDLVEEEVLVYINGLSVTDPDSRQFGKKSVRISIERPSECPLLVREHKVDNFVLMINQSMTLDYESTINFNCTLRATDGGNLSSTALLEIELLDINDNLPEADDVIEREIPRSSEIDYVIVSQINATDRDSGRNALLSFEFNTTNNNTDERYSFFEINDTNGKISIAKNLTTLQLDSVELTVIVSDDGLPQRLSTLVMVKINITDDNERPIFSRAEYREEVVENSKLEGVLMTVTAQDRKNEKLVECNCTYRLIDISDSNGSYTIEDVTGNLTVNVSGYDREKEPFITMTVVARDEGGKETSARVNITVLDQNDNDPKFLEDFQFEVYQEAPVGTCFGMVTAEDKDEGMNAVTLYKIIRDSITSSNYNDSVIVIEETTGELCSNESLNIGAVRDFTEHVRVEAIDKGDRNRRNRVTVSVIIKYNDTNQHHPTIHQVKQSDIEPISLKSRQTNIPVTTLRANDLDEGKDGEVEFSILEGNVLDMFTIDRDTGALSFSSKITMIGSHPVYLTVQATDKGVHPKSSTLTLNLTLEGEKESYIADKVKSAEEFMTYTWSLVGVACFLILVTAAAVFGFCQSRIKAHRDSELYDDNRRTFNGLKHNVSYGVNMPQMHLLQQDRTDTNAQRRTGFSSDSTSFESSLDRYPPERDGPEEFDHRRSFRISLFDRHAPAPQLPPPRESSGPIIPKPDYE